MSFLSGFAISGLLIVVEDGLLFRCGVVISHRIILFAKGLY